MKKITNDLPDWVFDINEISACAYKVVGKHKLGNIVEFTGIDTDKLLSDAISSAKIMELAIQKKLNCDSPKK